ncbi:DUF2306 domain-containing protein [Paenibacillus sp. GYB003]|uniref:DUF2306 domain-containing protein n=1 Tax=Paenibacillus sp. GYB003 TaxID=2994392 RepID=UPI002F964514
MVVVFVVVSLMWMMHTITKNFVSDPEFAKLIAAKESFAADRGLWMFLLRAHIILAVISLLAGPIGAIRGIRLKSPAWHRWNGRIYVGSVLLNIVPGLYVSWFAEGSWTIAGFLVLNLLWLATTWLGYVHIRRKNTAKHTQWITRSFFLTYANLTIHIVLPIGEHGLGLSYEASYGLAVWGGILLNLALAELVLRKKWMA